MAELALGIAGLITVAESAFGRIRKFIKRVRKADKQVNDLFILVTNLYGTLQGLDRIIKDFNFGRAAAERYNTHIVHCTDLLNRISRRLEKFQDSPGTASSKTSFSTRVKWPFSMEETQEIHKDVERHQAALGFSLVSEGLSIGLELQESIASVKDDIATIHEYIQKRSAATVSKEQQKVLSAISSLDPWEQHAFNIKAREAGTGIWFLESPEFKDWLSADNSRLWMVSPEKTCT